MTTAIEVLLALIPFAVLIAGFLVFKLNSLQTSLVAWLSEFAVIYGYYQMGFVKSFESAIWGGLTMWTGFLVVFSGMIFGQSYRTTGLLRVLLDSVESIFPGRDKEGRAIALVGVVGGFIGAFNGFATYPVTIPGLVELGYSGVQAITSYAVYFAWSIPFVSLFIGANIASAATHLPVSEIAYASGLFGIPLIFISLAGFFKLLGFRFFARETQILFWLLGSGNALGVILFCILFPTFYILTLIAASAISLCFLLLYGRFARGAAGAVVQSLSASAAPAEKIAPHATGEVLRAYAPLVLGAAYVILVSLPGISPIVAHARFRIAAWGYAPININLVTSAGVVILITAALCYAFRTKPATLAKDFVEGGKRSITALTTLFIGSAMVYQMVDTGQITLLGRVLSNGGAHIYAVLFPFLAFLGGMAFGQGLPADFLFSRMQIPAAPLLGIPLVILVGIVNIVTMGPPNPMKPAQITYMAHLVNIKGRDWEIFRTCLPWQILQIIAIALLASIFVLV